jgi:hypothetical protein
MSLAAIRAVLDRAAGEGIRLDFWWRDDDAVAATPALDRLLSLGREFRTPIAVAAIPARMEPSLPDRLQDEPGARILVHGLSHANHAKPGRKSAEFGSNRPPSALSADARTGLALARERSGNLLLPAFVPPWNRIDQSLAATLPQLGYAGLSTFGPREPVAGLAVANTHLDPVDWRGSRSAVNPERLAVALDRAIASPNPGPVGILTHHLIFDEALWRLTRALMDLLSTHDAARFPPLEEVWRAPNSVIEL